MQSQQKKYFYLSQFCKTDLVAKPLKSEVVCSVMKLAIDVSPQSEYKRVSVHEINRLPGGGTANGKG
jgi:hypothetical protein